MRFTEEELAIAKQTDLCAVAKSLGYTIKRVGKYHTLKEMDSIRIYDRSHWFRWSRQYDKGQNGGSQIDFLRVFAGMEVKEAVFWLLDFAGYQKKDMNSFVQPKVVETKVEEKKGFLLPEYAGNNVRAIAYLEKERCINRNVIEEFIRSGLLYEEREHHNIVFVGKDKFGTCRFASMRGTYDLGGKGFKCDVKGNDKRFGVNLVREESTIVLVFEAVIDLMSYMTIFPEQQENMLALGMLGDAPLETFLSEHKQVREIHFGLDNDEPGRKASAALLEKYQKKGYVTKRVAPPSECKDFNVYLKEKQKKMERNLPVDASLSNGVSRM